MGFQIRIVFEDRRRAAMLQQLRFRRRRFDHAAVRSQIVTQSNCGPSTPISVCDEALAFSNMLLQRESANEALTRNHGLMGELIKLTSGLEQTCTATGKKAVSFPSVAGLWLN